jgi:hypothetical protein
VLRKPGWHVCVASQQPAQLNWLHLGRHCSFWHVSPSDRQFWHCEPPEPHALSGWPPASTNGGGGGPPSTKMGNPPMQVLPWQHPWQFHGPQVVGATHAWFWQVSPSGRQFWHCAPAWPHAVSIVPAMHVLPWQQPAQLLGPHVVGRTQAPFEHVSPLAAQSWHEAPPKPHAVDDDPPTHVLPMQHPPQFCGPHVGCSVHAWFEQTSPEPAQFRHCAPPKPHAFDDVPTWHELPKQHPGQLLGPHVAWPWHAPLTHVSPNARQSWHVAPPKPHVDGVLPLRHVLPMQHPPQFCGPHVVCAVQKPPLHVSLNARQFWHCMPFSPQALELPPKTQTLPSQHPGQFWGPQNCVGVHAWFWQTSPKLKQFWHCSPAYPHCVESKPPTQVLPAQHPGQVAGPHAVVPPQTPPEPGVAKHAWPLALQLMHSWPPLPHAVLSVPWMHWPPKQQPLQLPGPHVGVVHCPLLQESPSLWQCRQIWPGPPHSFGSPPE